MSTERNSFSVRLEELLKARRMTQKELAEKAEVTEAAMSHYIKGDRVPRSAVMARIADALGTSTDYLMFGKESDSEAEINQAVRLIARNANQMSIEDKKRIVDILLGDD